MNLKAPIRDLITLGTGKISRVWERYFLDITDEVAAVSDDISNMKQASATIDTESIPDRYMELEKRISELERKIAMEL